MDRIRWDAIRKAQTHKKQNINHERAVSTFKYQIFFYHGTCSACSVRAAYDLPSAAMKTALCIFPSLMCVRMSSNFNGVVMRPRSKQQQPGGQRGGQKNAKRKGQGVRVCPPSALWLLSLFRLCIVRHAAMCFVCYVRLDYSKMRLRPKENLGGESEGNIHERSLFHRYTISDP